MNWNALANNKATETVMKRKQRNLIGNVSFNIYCYAVAVAVVVG